MAKEAFTFETQARWSVVLAVLGGLASMAALGLIAYQYRAAERITPFSTSGMWVWAFLAAVGAALACSAGGFALGLNSAGQKRNTRSGASWMGFFLSAGAATIALCVALFFWMTRLSV